MTRVLICVDDDSSSLRAARTAVGLFPDAEFLVLNVARVTTPWVGAAGFGMVMPVRPADWEVLFDAGQRTAQSVAAAAAEAAGIPDADIVGDIGETATAIIAAGNEHDADVIVVGSHDRGVLSRLFSPSVADAVVHGTPRPVLVVSGTPDDAADAGT